MIREYIIRIEDSLSNAENDIDELERKWGAEELPKGHGRLIDADALIKHIKNLTKCPNGYSQVYDEAMIINMIEDKPTIIEADSGGEDADSN